jgi:NAD(P)-dependent dehydrogenase (short-subunit alcohol dehydrogenase family)
MGCRLALCARDNGELLRAAARLHPHCSEVSTYQCDLTKAEEISGLISRVVAEMGSLDGLVNNAGLVQVGPAQEMTLDDYSEALDLMFWAPRAGNDAGRLLGGARSDVLGSSAMYYGSASAFPKAGGWLHCECELDRR